MMLTLLVIVLVVAAVSCGYFLGVMRSSRPRAGALQFTSRPQFAEAGVGAAPRPSSAASGSASVRGTGASSSAPDRTPAGPELDRTLVQGLIGAHDMSESDAVRAHIEQALLRTGIERIDAQVGEPFYPETHEAVAMVQPDDPADVQRIATVVRAGWRSQDRVIRPPQVEVWSSRA